VVQRSKLYPFPTRDAAFFRQKEPQGAVNLRDIFAFRARSPQLYACPQGRTPPARHVPSPTPGQKRKAHARTGAPHARRRRLAAVPTIIVVYLYEPSIKPLYTLYNLSRILEDKTKLPYNYFDAIAHLTIYL